MSIIMPRKQKPPNAKRAKRIAKRSRGRSKIEQDLIRQIKGKTAAASSSTSPPRSRTSSDASSSDLEAARPSRKRAREVGRPPSPLVISDSDSAVLARAVSQVSVQVGRLCSFHGFGVRRALRVAFHFFQGDTDGVLGGAGQEPTPSTSAGVRAGGAGRPPTPSAAGTAALSDLPSSGPAATPAARGGMSIVDAMLQNVNSSDDGGGGASDFGGGSPADDVVSGGGISSPDSAPANDSSNPSSGRDNSPLSDNSSSSSSNYSEANDSHRGSESAEDSNADGDDENDGITEFLNHLG